MAVAAERQRKVKPPHVSARKHNAVLEAAYKRVDALEPRLAEIIEPILDRAGKTAARKFEQTATRHLVAAAANSDVAKTATMIALKPRPDEAAALADPAGDPPEILHVTLAFLGDSDQPLQEIAEALKPVAATYGPLSGVVGGVGAFHPAGVGIVLPDARGLVETRQAVVQALHDAGIDYGRDHGFTPHITINGDGEPPDDSLGGQPLHFDSLHIVRGNDEEVELPLVGVRAVTAAGPPWSPPFPDQLIDVDALVKQILAKTDPVRRAMLEQTMTPALKQAGLSFDVSNPLTAQMLARSADQVTNIALTTRANIMKIIGAGIQNGLTVPQTASLIREGMAASSKARSVMIARTELGRAVNGGSLAATQLVQSVTGQAYDKIWNTAPGARYPRHEDYEGLDQQTRAMDEAFDVGGDALQFPGDPDGEPGETINCRCTLTYSEVPAAAGQAASEQEPSLAQTIEGDLKSLVTNESGQVKVPWPEPDLTTSSVEEAAKELAAGKNVKLAQASEVNTFIDDLGKMAADAQKAGKSAPDLDLGKVSVPGTNLFTQDSLGIPRIDMPQFGGLPIPGSPAEKLPTTIFEGKVSQWRDIGPSFFQSLRDQGIKVDAEKVNPETLRATQKELNGPKIADLMDRLEAGEAATDQPVIISSDNYILDGHHRWAASVGRDYKTGVDVPQPIAVERIDEPITTLLQQARDYSEKMGIPPQSAFDATKTVVTPPVPPTVPPTAMARMPEQSIDIGITPFRAGIDNAVGFYDSAKYQQFIEDTKQSAEAYGVHIDGIDKVTGIWEGDTEPSVSIHVSPTEPKPEDDTYKSQHRAPTDDGYDAPMYDLTAHDNAIYPDDIYTGATQKGYEPRVIPASHLYGTLMDKVDKESFDAVNRVHGDPSAMVTIYRAAPENVTSINPGDWVTPSKQYAELHGEGNLGQDVESHILSMQVPAGQLFTDGNSIAEWGWSPPHLEQFNLDARARAFSANLGKSYNQDGVLLFRADPKGADMMATFRTAASQDQVATAMARAGLSGGRFTADGRLQVIGKSSPDFVKQLTELGKDLGGYDVKQGAFSMMDRDAGDYQKALDAFSHPKGVTATTEPTAVTPVVKTARGEAIDEPKYSEMDTLVDEPAQKAWLGTLTTNEKDVVNAWSQTGSRDINNYLAGKKIEDSELAWYRSRDAVAKASADLEKVVREAPPLPPGTTLYRGIRPMGVDPTLRDTFAKIQQDAIANGQTDDIFSKQNDALADWAQKKYPAGSYVKMGEPGELTATTTDPAIAAAFQPGIVFRVVKGETGAPIWTESIHPEEHEVLAPSDTMYRVKSVTLNRMPVEGDTPDRVVVTVEEAPKCATPAESSLVAVFSFGVSCTDVAQPVSDTPKPSVTVGSGDLFPGQPRDAAEKAVRHRAGQIEQYAADNHMTVTEYKAAAQEVIQSYVSAHPQIRIRVTPETLAQIIKDGRYKTEYELPGVTPEMAAGRAEAEQKMFGYSGATDPTERPVYGYLAGTANEGGIVQEYGDLILNLDPVVNARATFTVGDSYRAAIKGQLSPSLLSKPGIGSWTGDFDIVKAYQEGDLEDISQYVEVEIHGGLSSADIGSITPDTALIMEREDARRVREAVEAATELYANNKGTQQASPQTEQAGIPTEKPASLDYASSLLDLAKKAATRQGAIADLLARVGLAGKVTDNYQDFKILGDIGNLRF